MAELSDSQLLTIVVNVVEKRGCKVIEVDFENRWIKLEGPEESKEQCAMDLEEILGDRL